MNSNTIVYLIRHSRKIDEKTINSDKDTENYQVYREKRILSIEGEERAKILSIQKEFDDVDAIYSSNYVRAIQTAKYLSERKNLIINIDNRFNERKIGILTDMNFYLKQYSDENFKNPEGESRKEATQRMYEGLIDAINNNKGKKIAIFTHGASMTYLLMKWCKLESINEDKIKVLSFNNNIINNKCFDATETFKLIFDENNNIIDIKNIEFEDLK